jgi:signal transduction histidine kinase
MESIQEKAIISGKRKRTNSLGQIRNSIGARILLGFAIMVAISLVVAITSIYSTSLSGSELSKQIQQDQRVTNAILPMEKSVESQFSSVRAFLLLTENPEIGLGELTGAREQFQRSLKELIALFDEANIDRTIFEEVNQLYGTFSQTLDEVKNIDSRNFPNAGKSYLERKARLEKEELIQTIDKKLALYRDVIGKRTEEARNRSNLVTYISLLLVFVAALGAVIVSTVITRSITRPLQKLAATSDAIRQGNYEVIVPEVKGNDEVARLSRAVGDMTYNLIEGRRKLEGALIETKERNRDLQAINRINSAVTSSLNLDEVLNEALDDLLGVTGLEFGSVYLLDETGKNMYLAAHRNQSDFYLEHYYRMEVGDNLFSAVLSSKNVVVIENLLDKLGDELPRQDINQKNFYIGIPLTIKGKLLGVFNLASSTNRSLRQGELEVLRTIGSQIAIAIENANLYNQASQLAALEERNRLARDLHDSVTQTLFSITLTAESMRTMMQKKPEKVEGQLERLQNLARGALAEMRALIFQLRPAALEEQGLVIALQKHIGAMQSKDHLKINFNAESEKRLSNEHEQTLYRIAQEALNNVVKHSEATLVDVELNFGDKETVLVVRDNGVGFDPQGDAAERNRTQKSLGMSSMHERARLAGGTLELISKPGQGTTITVRLPVSAAPRPVGVGIN